MILAEVAQQPLTWTAVLGVLGLVALLLGVIEKARGLLGGKERREVSFTREFVAKEEFEKEKAYGQERRKAIYAMIDETRRDTATQIDAFRREVRDDVKGVHERIDDVAVSLGEMRGEIKQALKK